MYHLHHHCHKQNHNNIITPSSSPHLIHSTTKNNTKQKHEPSTVPQTTSQKQKHQLNSTNSTQIQQHQNKEVQKKLKKGTVKYRWQKHVHSPTELEVTLLCKNALGKGKSRTYGTPLHDYVLGSKRNCWLLNQLVLKQKNTPGTLVPHIRVSSAFWAALLLE